MVTYKHNVFGDNSYYASKSYKSSSLDSYTRCYHSHPALKMPGTEIVIYGGSCSSPAVKDADIYIGFDFSMRFTARHWPWKKGTEVQFMITDMHAPDDAEEFRKLVEWTKKQLDDGKKVHAGCIGGHGRTGTFFAALVSLYGEKDSIAYVREHYCKKAVESKAQIDFLVKEYKVKRATGSKTVAQTRSRFKDEDWSDTASTKVSPIKKASTIAPSTFRPLSHKRGIWG